jgi:hypothetical protein
MIEFLTQGSGFPPSIPKFLLDLSPYVLISDALSLTERCHVFRGTENVNNKPVTIIEPFAELSI